MQYRHLGRSGLKISPICLGTMMFGGPTDEATSARIVAKAREAGINFIDTADAYNGGNSEQVVGRAISTSRHNWIPATKLANPMGDHPNRRGPSRCWAQPAPRERLNRRGRDRRKKYGGGEKADQHVADGVGPGILKAGDGKKEARGAPRHHRRSVRGVLGIELVVRLRGDRRTTHRGTLGRLSARARL